MSGVHSLNVLSVKCFTLLTCYRDNYASPGVLLMAGYWSNWPAVRMFLSTYCSLTNFIKKFSSKCFTGLWKTVVSLLKMLIKPSCTLTYMYMCFCFETEKSGGKNEETNGDRKTPNSDKSSRSSSPAQSTKSSSAPSTPQDNKVVTFPPPKVTGDSVRGRCREMIVNSLKIEGEFEPSRSSNCYHFVIFWFYAMYM